MCQAAFGCTGESSGGSQLVDAPFTTAMHAPANLALLLLPCFVDAFGPIDAERGGGGAEPGSPHHAGRQESESRTAPPVVLAQRNPAGVCEFVRTRSSQAFASARSCLTSGRPIRVSSYQSMISTSLRGWRSQERGGSNPPFRTNTLRMTFRSCRDLPDDEKIRLPLIVRDRYWQSADRSA